MTTSVRVNTHTYATTHVATSMLRGLKQIIRESGLSIDTVQNQWTVLKSGVATWLDSRHLKTLVLEVYDPDRPAGRDLVGRFDFTIDYGYYSDGEGDLWLDPDTVAYTVRKNGSYPSRCAYRLIADTASEASPYPAGLTPPSDRPQGSPVTRPVPPSAAAASGRASATTPGAARRSA